MFLEEFFGNDADASDYASENPGLKFITCHELHDAIARAFNTWSNNNKMIKFTDVTEQCKDDPDVNEGSCAYAEFVIMPDLAYAEEKGLAAYVEMRMVRQSAPAVHMTSGAAMSQAIVVRPSTMHVRATGICWYLDTTFCYQIFRWQNVGGLDVITLMRAVVSFLVIAAVGMLTWVLVQLLRAVCCPKAAGSRTSSAEASLGRRTEGGTTFCRTRCEAVSHYLAMPVDALLSLFILVFTPIFTAPAVLGLLRLRGDDRPRGGYLLASSTPTSSPRPTSAPSTRRRPRRRRRGRLGRRVRPDEQRDVPRPDEPHRARRAPEGPTRS